MPNLIFVLLLMAALFGLQAFYQRIDQAIAPAMNDVGHFNIFRIEDIPLSHSRKPAYNKRSFFKVSLITGHNKLHYADTSIEVNGTALVFTNPTIPYFWEMISEKQAGYMCIFTEPFFSRFVNIKDYTVFQSPDMAVMVLNKKQLPVFRNLFVKMTNELQGIYIHKYDLLRNLLMELIHEAQKLQPAITHPAGSNASERIAVMFAELLERQFPIELQYQVMKLTSPAAFAQQLHVHVNHLNKALKEATGQTTSQLINGRILQEAGILLKSTNWTIAEVAFSLGFEESNHFSAFFKSRTNLTPNQFRKLNAD